MHSILAIKIHGRTSRSQHLQEILTKYGCYIRTRVGFHETDNNHCSTDGFIILQLFGEEKEIKALFDEIYALEGITPKFIEF